MQKLRNDEQDAYRYLYDRRYILLCRLANELVDDPFLAETIVSNVIFHLWEIRETLDINSSLRAYLIQAVRNRCYNHISLEREKKEIRSLRIESKTLGRDAMTQSGEQPLGILLERELEKEIIKSVDSLGDGCRRVFRKSRLEHKKNEEIATELGISINTVKYYIKMALTRLHQDLRKYLILLTSFFSLRK